MGFENILSGRLGDHSQAMYDEAFDIILAGEVIEHTDDPGGGPTGSKFSNEA